MIREKNNCRIVNYPTKIESHCFPDFSKNSCTIDSKLFVKEANEVIFKLMADVLSLVSGSYYPPRSKKILHLINQLQYSKFKKCTLGKCIFEKKGSLILVTREIKIKRL